MDRNGSSLEATVQDIEQKLNVICLTVQMPIGENTNFKGVVDLIAMEKIVFSDALGTSVIRGALAVIIEF